MEHIQIRRVLSTELEQLQAISIETFTETFGAANTQENMQKYLQENFGTEKLANELADPDSEFYFAVLDNSVIGYLKINFGQAQTELKDGRGRRGCAPVFNGVDVYATYINTVNIVCSKLYSSMDYL